MWLWQSRSLFERIRDKIRRATFRDTNEGAQRATRGAPRVPKTPRDPEHHCRRSDCRLATWSWQAARRCRYIADLVRSASCFIAYAIFIRLNHGENFVIQAEYRKLSISCAERNHTIIVHVSDGCHFRTSDRIGQKCLDTGRIIDRPLGFEPPAVFGSDDNVLIPAGLVDLG